MLLLFRLFIYICGHVCWFAHTDAAVVGTPTDKHHCDLWMCQIRCKLKCKFFGWDLLLKIGCLFPFFLLSPRGERGSTSIRGHFIVFTQFFCVFFAVLLFAWFSLYRFSMFCLPILAFFTFSLLINLPGLCHAWVNFICWLLLLLLPFSWWWTTHCRR